VSLENVELEKFSVYKFSIDYPPVCRVEFNPKSRREKGHMVFHFPDEEKLFLSWGELEQAQKKFPTSKDHANHSIKVMKKMDNVKDLEIASQDSIMVNTHDATYSRLKFEGVALGLVTRRKGVPHQAYSLHVHCDQTSRYFVIYAMLSKQAPEDFSELFVLMANSFKCH
jgi:hypothetical protein